ncbi:hypothetical protein SORBI_3004G267650 [Sorghum bicolor]|uniref:Uncharacterized protein n=1 Tax=Sorghum bicolor TaxID=4558 RepID=A0A1Z5RPS8_SORBI|nr:hypothetical protein SORBI_3004G267650 [Sorghum bicolor]
MWSESVWGAREYCVIPVAKLVGTAKIFPSGVESVEVELTHPEIRAARGPPPHSGPCVAMHKLLVLRGSRRVPSSSSEREAPADAIHELRPASRDSEEEK